MSTHLSIMNDRPMRNGERQEISELKGRVEFCKREFTELKETLDKLTRNLEELETTLSMLEAKAEGLEDEILQEDLEKPDVINETRISTLSKPFRTSGTRDELERESLGASEGGDLWGLFRSPKGSRKKCA